MPAPTHHVRYGRSYGRPASRNGAATHLAYRDREQGGWRTLCGRTWDSSEENAGGEVYPIGGAPITPTADPCQKCHRANRGAIQQ